MGRWPARNLPIRIATMRSQSIGNQRNMSLNKVLKLLPAGSPFRELIRDLVSSDLQRRNDAYSRVRKIDSGPSVTWDEIRVPTWLISEQEALAILKAAEVLVFPLPDPNTDWKDGLEWLLTLLWRSPYPSLVPSIGRAYANLNNGRRRCTVLSLLGIIGTCQAAEGFMNCVRENGWPDRVFGRIFEELPNLLVHGDVMLPDVLLTCGTQLATGVGDAVIAAISSRKLEVHEIGSRVEALAPFVKSALRKALKLTAKHQSKPGIAWRFAERYQDIRHRACMFLDLTGRINDSRLSPLLREAAEFSDPRIVTFALLSLLRRGEKVPRQKFNLAASSHETRVILFKGLRALGREREFPKKWNTWDAFAAAQMVDWLIFPTELGREPDQLELKKFDIEVNVAEGRTVANCVWRFRIAGGPWLAGASGPHELQDEPQPFGDSLTFSRFEEWDNATPDEHLMRCMGTAGEILGLREES